MNSSGQTAQPDAVGPVSAEERASILAMFSDGPGGEVIPLHSSVSGKAFAEDVAERRGQLGASQYNAYGKEQDELDARVKGMMADAAADAAARRRFTDKFDAQDRRAAASRTPAAGVGGYGNSPDQVANVFQFAQTYPALAGELAVYDRILAVSPDKAEAVKASLLASPRAHMTLRSDYQDAAGSLSGPVQSMGPTRGDGLTPTDRYLRRSGAYAPNAGTVEAHVGPVLGPMVLMPIGGIAGLAIRAGFGAAGAYDLGYGGAAIADGEYGEAALRILAGAGGMAAAFTPVRGLTTMDNPAIAGARFSGLRATGSSEAAYDALAERAYGSIRAVHMSDVRVVAENAGMSLAEAATMKKHLFFGRHEYAQPDGSLIRARFAADMEVATAWRTAQTRPLMEAEAAWFQQLGRHELGERQLMAQGLPYRAPDSWGALGWSPTARGAHNLAPPPTLPGNRDFPGFDIMNPPKKW